MLVNRGLRYTIAAIHGRLPAMPAPVPESCHVQTLRVSRTHGKPVCPPRSSRPATICTKSGKQGPSCSSRPTRVSQARMSASRWRKSRYWPLVDTRSYPLRWFIGAIRTLKIGGYINTRRQLRRNQKQRASECPENPCSMDGILYVLKSKHPLPAQKTCC